MAASGKIDQAGDALNSGTVPLVSGSDGMPVVSQLDRLLVTLDVDVQSFALCNVQRGRRLIPDPVSAVMVHYVLAGTHHMTIDGFDPIVCSAGCIIVIPPGLVPKVGVDAEPAVDVQASGHSILTREGILIMDATDGGEPDLRFLSGIVQASFSGSFGLFDNLRKPISQYVCSTWVEPAFDMMLKEAASSTPGARALTSALMKSCLVLVLRQAWTNGELGRSLFGPLSDRRLANVIDAVIERPAHPHSVASLARLAGMSRSTFCRAFQEAFQVSPMEFVAKTRLHHAAQLLRSTPLPTKVIAANVGFLSRSHFSRAFTAAYGIDPTRFRSRTRSISTEPPGEN
jgi:AraC family transcriptional regulator, activator of mtrCDE